MVNVRMKTSIKMKAEGNCPSHSLAEVSVRDVVQIIDEPIERGGTNQGATPTETAVNALIGCTNVIAHKCANKLGHDIGHLNITAICTFNRLGVTLAEEIEVPFEAIELKITSDGTADETQLVEVAAEVAKFCPLSKLFKSAGTKISEVWVKA